MKGIFPSLKTCHFVLNHIRSVERKRGWRCYLRQNIDLYDFLLSKAIWMSDTLSYFYDFQHLLHIQIGLHDCLLGLFLNYYSFSKIFAWWFLSQRLCSSSCWNIWIQLNHRHLKNSNCRMFFCIKTEPNGTV